MKKEIWGRKEQEQQEEEEVIEIDENGNIYKPGKAPRSRGTKPIILRDPEGEYSYDSLKPGQQN